MKTITCDLCGCSDYEIFLSKEEWIWLPNEYRTNLVQCLQCRLIYQNPQLDSIELNKFYDSNYEPYVTPISEEKNRIKKIFRLANIRKKTKLIERYYPNGGRILDVGCSTGVFLSQMKVIGWECFGVEPNNYAALIAQKNRGINVVQGYLSDLQEMNNYFDVITFWDVLEHTYSPMNELHLAYNLLKPRGILVINIPNWDAFDREWLGKYWQGYDPPRHLYVFNKNTLIEYLSKTGFKLIETLTIVSSYYAFIMGFIRKLENESCKLARIVKFLLLMPGMRLLFEPWLRIYHNQNRSSVITYVAQKL
ncbi:MAG: class I SAM-dependent methyltransferase [Chloroflexota bacterium]